MKLSDLRGLPTFVLSVPVLGIGGYIETATRHIPPRLQVVREIVDERGVLIECEHGRVLCVGRDPVVHLMHKGTMRMVFNRELGRPHSEARVAAMLFALPVHGAMMGFDLARMGARKLRELQTGLTATERRVLRKLKPQISRGTYELLAEAIHAGAEATLAGLPTERLRQRIHAAVAQVLLARQEDYLFANAMGGFDQACVAIEIAEHWLGQLVHSWVYNPLVQSWHDGGAPEPLKVPLDGPTLVASAFPEDGRQEWANLFRATPMGLDDDELNNFMVDAGQAMLHAIAEHDRDFVIQDDGVRLRLDLSGTRPEVFASLSLDGAATIG